MSIFSEYPRKNYIPLKVVSLSDYSFQLEIVLDHMKAKYNTMFSRAISYTDFMVDESVAGRLDLISWKVYGTVDMWWILGYYNGVVNPIFDLEPGKKLKIPRLTDLQFALEVNATSINDARRVVDIL